MYKLFFIILVLIAFTHPTSSLTCWSGDSRTSSTALVAKSNNYCVKYLYNSTYYVYTSLSSASIATVKAAPTSSEFISCSTDYCNTLVNPKTICYYSEGVNTFLREFTSTDRYCYSYPYYCSKIDQYCIGTGYTKTIYGITSNDLCAGINSTVISTCCVRSYCNGPKATTTSTRTSDATMVGYSILIVLLRATLSLYYMVY